MPDPTERLNAALEGRYSIQRELGEGGMATVYLAEDLKHERKVALKVLKPELSAVVGAARFLAEIKTTANLQHPHILPLFDSGEAEEFLFYVMPFVEGEDLRDKLDREHQLPVDEAVRIATNMAEALDYAHRQGVVHRDIKPANVLLLDGKAVIADFGIALAIGAAGGGRLTETGLSIGTPFYMSPEQATGDQQVGPPSDTYALAAMLYEMLTGDPPYIGSTAQAVLGKIIQGDPVSATEIRTSVPANVDAAIRKALEKLPADRFADAQGFAKALADPGFRYGEVVAGGVGATGTAWKRVSMALAAVAVTVLAWTSLQPSTPGAVERFTLATPPGPRLPPALLPDGSGMVVVRADDDGLEQLWLRRWNDLALRPISGTEGDFPAFLGVVAVSPDGAEVAFVVDSELKVAAVEGGGVRTLTDSVLCCPRWGRDGFLYFSGVGRGIDRVPPSGGRVEPVTTMTPEDAVHSDFILLPGGEVGVFGQWGAAPQIEAVHLASGERTVLTPGMRPYLTSEGQLLFTSLAGEILAAPLDTEGMELIDAPVTLVDGVFVNGVPYPLYTVSASGTLIYEAGEGSRVVEPVWVTRAGEASPVDPEWTADPGPSGNFGFRISPDGSRVAFSQLLDENEDIWIKALPDGPVSRLTFDSGRDFLARWRPDNTTVTFTSDRGGSLDLWAKRPDGVGQPELLFDLERDVALGAWSPDGQWLAIRLAGRVGFLGARDIVAQRIGDDSEPIAVLASQYSEQAPAISPNGRWIAYSLDETGRVEVFVSTFPDVAGGKWQISTEGGVRPLWAHSGRELFFVENVTNELVVTEIGAGADFDFGATRTLFTIPAEYRLPSNGDFYDISTDDQRFLMARPAERTMGESPGLILVQNWFEELKQRMGGN